MSNKLKISFNNEGNAYTLSAEGTPVSSSPNADFFRIMMDDDYYKEVNVPSHLQHGTVKVEGNVTTITYPFLVDATGRKYDTEFIVRVEDNGEDLIFTSEIRNHEDVRVNEVQLPFLDFSKVCNEDRSKDVLYRSRGMGERMADPWTAIGANHTEYMSADYYEIWSPLVYPRPCNMAWIGLQSGEDFLYMGRQDEEQAFNTCTFNVGINPRNTDPRLIFTVCHYPLCLKGETLSTAKVLVNLKKGTWKDGSKKYSEWADSTWHAPLKKAEWVNSFTGWQRIILRHQYGEIFWKYTDLVEAWENGMKYGIDTVMVFGWWKGRFDNGYPHYEPDDALGGADELQKAIRTIQGRGGRVILYTNGVLMDVKSEFYKKHGLDVARIDIDGNPYADHYQFSNQGTILRNFGYKTFAEVCQGTDEWKEKLCENGKIKLAFKPDSIFFDQIGGHHCWLCFNPKHKHGNRGDRDAFYRAENFKALRELLGNNQAIGTETTVDLFDSYMDYHHGCDFGNWYAKNVFPEMYLNTFPDTIITNRFLHDERFDYKKQLNYTFAFGFRFDVCLYRGRLIDLDSMPGYAEQVKRIIDLKEKYKKFFYPAHFEMGNLEELPEDVLAGRFTSGEEAVVTVVNCSEEKKRFTLAGKQLELESGDAAIIYGDLVEKVGI